MLSYVDDSINYLALHAHVWFCMIIWMATTPIMPLDFIPWIPITPLGQLQSLLWDLEKAFVISSRTLSENSRTTHVYKVLLVGSEICKTSLPKKPTVLVEGKSLPPILHMQIHNCAKDKNCRFVFDYFYHYWWHRAFSRRFMC